MHPYILTGSYVFVDDHRARGWRVDGNKVTTGREGAYWDQLEERGAGSGWNGSGAERRYVLPDQIHQTFLRSVQRRDKIRIFLSTRDGRLVLRTTPC